MESEREEPLGLFAALGQEVERLTTRARERATSPRTCRKRSALAESLAMSLALGHALGLLVLAMLFWSTGYLLGALVRKVEVPALGTFLVHTTTGLIAWIYLLFLLASIGLFRAAVVLPTAATVLAVAAGWVALRMESHPPWVELRGHWRAEASWRAVARALSTGLLPGVLLLAIYFIDLSPDIGWDDNVYHLTLPKLYLLEGGFRRVPFSVYSNWPLNVELLFGLAMMGQDYVLAKLVHAFFLLLIVLAVFRICRQQASRGVSVLATLLVLANPVLLFEAERAYIDIAFAFFFLVAVACAIEYLRSAARPALALSGLCCGALAGTKLSGLAGLPCVLAVLLAQRPVRIGKQGLLSIALLLVLPTFALAVPWYLKSYLYTGNPVYPLLFRVFGGAEWSARLGQEFAAWQQSIGMGRSLYDYFALPVRIVADGARGYAHFDGQIGSFWLIAVPVSMSIACFERSMRPYLLCSGVYFVLWALSSQQSRFLIAVLPLLAIATGIAIAWICERVPGRAPRAALWAALVVGTCWTMLPIFYPSCRHALAEARDLIRGRPADARTPVPAGYAFINASTPQSSRIMLLNTNHGFFLDREYIADSFFEASQMNFLLSPAKSEEEMAEILAKLRVTHMYVSQTDWGIPYSDVLSQFLNDRRHTEVIYRCPGETCTLYELRR